MSKSTGTALTINGDMIMAPRMIGKSQINGYDLLTANLPEKNNIKRNIENVIATNMTALRL
jgi:hypothetical protein